MSSGSHDPILKLLSCNTEKVGHKTMSEIHVHVHLDGVPSSVRTIHVHVPVVHDPALEVKVDQVMAGVSELMTKVTEVSGSVQNVLTVQSELVKDVQRLLAADNTQAAIDALSGAETSLNSAAASLQDLDAAVEAASPEPTPTPETPAAPDSLLGE